MKYIPSSPPPPPLRPLLGLMAKPCRDTHCQFFGCSVCMCTCLCAQVQSDEQQRRLLSKTTRRRRRLCCFYCVARRASTTSLNQTLRISAATTCKAKKKKKTKEKNKAREKKVEYRSRRGWILMIYEDCVRRESEPGLRRE
ncbi:unnamed protein product [Trichogramma brassicae]|uniref:Uncharacterized protein n=1 Tax=Trichogramma brassicae TaxID=86971 RepID=A0A6H5IL97_9HYME|nr:unnamed protein product [Trichogramma brassicae]